MTITSVIDHPAELDDVFDLDVRRLSLTQASAEPDSTRGCLTNIETCRNCATGASACSTCSCFGTCFHTIYTPGPGVCT